MIRVSFEVATIEEAEEIFAAVRLLKMKPYRMKGFGPPVVDEVKEEMEMKDEPLAKVSNIPVIERKNVSPGEPNIVKCGISTMEILLNDLAKGVQPPVKYEEHMKLLWKRGKVKYDGKEYYL